MWLRQELEQVYILTLDDESFIFDRSNSGSISHDGPFRLYREDLHRHQGARGPSFARAQLIWRIPFENLALFGDAPQINVLLAPTWSVLLDTGPNTGRSAQFNIELTGSADATAIGSATDFRAIGNDDRLQSTVTDQLGFGGSPPSGPPPALWIQLKLTCDVQPGTTLVQIGEQSLCDVGFTIKELRVRITRTEDL